MSDKLQAYHEGTSPIGNTNRLWPLYGAGLENLGQEGKPIDVPAPILRPRRAAHPARRHRPLLLRHQSDQARPQPPPHRPRHGEGAGGVGPRGVAHRGRRRREPARRVQGRRSLHRPGRDQRQRLQHGLRLPAAGRAVGLQRDRPAHPERRRRQLSDPGAAGDRLCRKRAHRAVGLRHRGLWAEISHRVESRRHGVDRRRPDRGQGSGREQGTVLHDQRWVRCAVAPGQAAADTGSGRVRGLAARTFGCPRHRSGGGRRSRSRGCPGG